MIELALDLAPRSERHMTYEEAILYCAFCTHDGYNDWRLPTQDEYMLISVQQSSWFIDRQTTVRWRVVPVRDI